MKPAKKRSRARRGSVDKNFGKARSPAQLNARKAAPDVKLAGNFKPQLVTAYKRQMRMVVDGVIEKQTLTPDSLYERVDPLLKRGVKVGEPFKGRERISPQKVKNPRTQTVKRGETQVEGKLTQLSNCKPRPRDNTGNGGSRSFVPWCKK